MNNPDFSYFRTNVCVKHNKGFQNPTPNDCDKVTVLLTV